MLAIGLTPGMVLRQLRHRKDRILTHLGKKVGRFEKMTCAAKSRQIKVSQKLAANQTRLMAFFAMTSRGNVEFGVIYRSSASTVFIVHF